MKTVFIFYLNFKYSWAPSNFYFLKLAILKIMHMEKENKSFY